MSSFSSTSQFSLPFIGRRNGQPLRRSNVLDSKGYNAWNDYHLLPIDTHHSDPYHHAGNRLLVDQHGKISTTPIDLALKYSYCDPVTTFTKLLWVRDTELKWNEIIAGSRSGIIPERYVEEYSHDGTRYGPMNRENFTHMISNFYVSPDSVLYKDSLRVATVPDDFEWKVLHKLPTMVHDFNLDNYDEQLLVADVQHHFQIWHLDAHERASKILNRYSSRRVDGL
ncbi:hypothetical protein DFH05DRAFT_1524880 [Lentinula detonsa]|uniref:Uncharacterized protein n=1 Tax=Lentinula detonsa TaxID=2804962 RepID=A0A9W8NZF2_9AGAR|nr:hypothetical protein DFH05DRAFT_1524880 [Lentinula detonsa]